MLNIPVLSRYTNTIKGYPKLYLFNRKIVEEHRYVMTQYLGRELNPTEVIHHIDDVGSLVQVQPRRLLI